MQLKFFHDVKCIIFIIEVLLLSPFINNFFGIILTYPTNHDILYHKSHWTCRLIANLLQKWLVITVRPTTSVRESPQKNLPPRNTPDSFCRRFAPTKSIAALLGRYFSLWETYLENFISRPDVIPTFRQRRCKTGAGTSFGANGDYIYEQWPLTYFCVLTIRKHLSKVDFERSGRGQEPSRGHKFSILENFLPIRDFTSQTLASFQVILLG